MKALRGIRCFCKATGLAMVFLASLTAFTGCASDNQTKEAVYMDNERFFNSAEEAVETIRQLLREKRWAELSEYYDLTGSDIDIASLRDGSYFMLPDEDAVVHPALAGSPLRPFSPAFSYRFHEDEGQVVRVHVGVRIDQGGGMVQEGLDSFVLVKTGRGLRVRPEK